MDILDDSHRGRAYYAARTVTAVAKKSSSVTSLIKGLEKRELIRRLTSETDGRSYSIAATAEAIALVEPSKHVAFGVLGKALHNFDSQQQQQLHELLNMFVENLLGENNG